MVAGSTGAGAARTIMFVNYVTFHGFVFSSDVNRKIGITEGKDRLQQTHIVELLSVVGSFTAR